MANTTQELILKAKRAASSNRGLYPRTLATNVFTKSGNPIESSTELPKPTVTIDPADPESETVANVIASVEDNAVIAITAGTIEEELVLDKSLTIRGVNAGIAQNYEQEV